MKEVIEGFRISPQQKRLWTLYGADGFAARCVIRIDGSLDRPRLEDALRAVVGRHEILRTNLRLLPEMEIPVQVVGTAEPDFEEFLDLRQMQQADREARIGAAWESFSRPFDIQFGPVVRTRMITVTGNEHLLLLALPAFCADTAALHNLAAEIESTYLGAGGEDSDPVAPMQYADIAEWMNAAVTSDESEPGRRFWREQEWADGFSAALPFRKATCGEAHFAPKSFEIPFPDNGTGVADAGTVLGAWALALHRYGMESEHGISVISDGRVHEELKSLPGLYARCLPVSIPIDRAVTFGELTRRASDQIEAISKWQDCFEWLPASSGKFFPFCFECRAANLGGHMQIVRSDTRIDRFHLKLVYEGTERNARLRFEWDDAVYDLEDVSRLARSLNKILESCGASRNLPVADIEVLDEAQYAQLITGFNSTGVAFPRGYTLPRLLAKQAERTPERIAVVYEESGISYAELNERANRLAAHLRRFGVKPETAVSVCMERSIEMVVAIFGVLKAGAAYVPVDPGYPADRIRHMLEDSGTAVVLTQDRLAAQLPPCRARIIPIDAEWGEIARESHTNPRPHAGAENPAYIIYTSGSTGKPKGVVITHRAICNHMFWMQSEFPFTREDRVLQKTPFSFDASVWEFYAPLFVGATLVMARPGGHQDPAYLVETIRRDRITILQLVPTLLAALLETPGFENCDSLRAVFCGGEPLTVELRQRFQARSNADLNNLYGPTEATIDATYWRCSPDEDMVPIGRPIANTEIHVLDVGLRPAPVGVPGEIYIGGEGLARGYWRRPDLTADRFVPDPFGARPGGRLYRTGDLGRRLPDGRLDCLGRLDHQVKLRGFRIELGEIEARLNEHSDVRQSVVIAREDTPGDRRLVAYVVPAAEAKVNAVDLRRHLAAHLPEYMTPAAFVELNEMPLTPNGKLDRRALPAPEGAALESGYVAPRSATEELLAGIWAELLRLERIGVNDNFFAAGGHSLLATQVVARVRAVLGVELPLRTLFEAPTIAQLAVRVAALRGVEESEQPKLERAEGVAREQLSWAQQRLWFLEQLETAPGLYHMLLAVRLRGALETAALESALNQVVERHEALRTRFVMRAGEPAAVVVGAWPVALAVRDLGGMDKAAQEQQWRAQAGELVSRPFDLASGRLLRAELIELNEAEHILLVCVHHLVADGWSLGVLAGELGELYRAAREGRAAPLAPLRVQYGDYAAWQRAWLAGAMRERQMEYWKKQLAGSPAALELPTDKPRPMVATRAGASCHLRLERALVEKLEALSRREGVTLFMTLLAAFQTLLSRYSGQTDIAVGTPVANRTRAELEALVGMFVNTLVLRTDLAGDPTFSQLLGRVREVCLEAYAHPDLPFEQLVEALEPERDLSRHPLFQVMFVMQNHALDLRLGDLEAEVEDTPAHLARFDLALILNPSAGGLDANLQYSTEIYHADTIHRILRHYLNLLEAVAGDVSTRVSELPLLNEEERTEILVMRNRTTEELEPDRRADVLLAARAAEHPNGIAILYGNSAITYRELNARANQLARVLETHGAGPEQKIGISLESSPRLIVAMLAVLKTGAAFVPLAPDYPAERLSFMIADSGASLIITEDGIADRLPRTSAALLFLDRMESAIANESDANPPARSCPEGAAYVIYTSGSTGKPKGVVIEHRALCNLMPAMSRAFQFHRASRILQFASSSFDASIGEIFPGLWTCAAIVMAPRDRVAPGDPLLEILREHGVTAAILPPSVLAVLPDEGLPALETVISAGEACPAPVAARWGRGRLFLNAYGPTENSVCATVFACCQNSEQPPIGRPIGNVRTYILDNRLDPVPDGVAGELYIAGESLARGYLSRPELTGEKFVPDPFSNSPSRLYRSGDLARYTSGGDIEFLGRIDQQVKIRGFRIEPAEIEAVLLECPGVRSAAVMACGAAGEKTLVAWVVTESPLPAADLRGWLSAKLPGYMLPSAFVNVPELPLTSSGKIDRAALPEPEQHGIPRSEYAPPRNPLEEILADIWGSTLRKNPVGIHDNFFEMGGHSLLAADLVFRIRDLLRFDVPLRAIFESPTIAGLTESMCRDSAAAAQLHEIAAILKQVSEMPESAARAALGEVKEAAAR